MRLIILISIFLSIKLQAQSISSELISNASDYFKSEKVQVEFTIGEIAIGSYGIVTEGFLQGSVNYRSGIHEISPKLNNEIGIYPNPFNIGFYLSVPKHSEAINIKVFDLLGKVVLQKNNLFHENFIETTELSDGIYIVCTYQNDKKTGTFRMTKN